MLMIGLVLSKINSILKPMHKGLLKSTKRNHIRNSF